MKEIKKPSVIPSKIAEIAAKPVQPKGSKKTRDRVGLYLNVANYKAVKTWAEARGSNVSEVVDALLEDLIREQNISVRTK